MQEQPRLTLSQTLAQIELPDNPTRGQCEAFVNELRSFTVRNAGDELAVLAIKRINTPDQKTMDSWRMVTK